MTDAIETDDDEPKGELALKTLAMPSDTNPAGDIFSGWLMGQMDIVSGIVARQRAGGHAVTVAVDGFCFTSQCVSVTSRAAIRTF